MPKDHWRKAKNQQIATQARREYAANGPQSFARLSDEIVPLDRINVLQRGLSGQGMQPVTKSTAPAKQTERLPRPNKERLVEIRTGAGATVTVWIAPGKGMTVEQCLRKALEVWLLTPDEQDAAILKPANQKPERNFDHRIQQGEVSSFREKLAKLADDLTDILKKDWVSNRRYHWKQELAKTDNWKGYLLQLDLGIEYSALLTHAWKHRREQWRKECQNLRQLRVLLDEFSKVARTLRRDPRK